MDGTAVSKLNKTDHVEDYSIDTNTEICSTSDIETTKETRLKDSRVHYNHFIIFIFSVLKIELCVSVCVYQACFCRRKTLN